MAYKITIVCITYNQEKYIKQALDSFVMQKTNFDFQVIVSDDASTDNTPNIIKEYETKYPNIIKAFYHKANKGAMKNYLFALSQADSEYLIVNEGDDYFIDPNKLQKQVDFLEANPEYSICFHPVKVIYENNPKKTAIYPLGKFSNDKLTFEKLLGWNFIQTNSVVYRWRFYNENIDDIFPVGILPGDWYLHLCHAKVGKIGVINEVMSVYRKHAGGIWYDTDAANRNLHRKYGLKQLKFYNSVYENLADRSEKYLVETYLPSFKQIVDNYYSFGDIDKLSEIKSLYPEIFERVIQTQNPIGKKLKKYKKYYTYLLVLSVILLILNLLLFFFLFIK